MARIKTDGKVEFEFWSAVVIDQERSEWKVETQTGKNELLNFATLRGA